MGVTIHYRGRLDDAGQLPNLCEELIAISDGMHWQTTRLDDDWEIVPDARLEHGPRGAEIIGHLGLKGLLISPDDHTEPISFLFDREGNLRSFMDTIFIIEGSLKPEDAWVFVKTQFGSPETHAWIVGLLRYIKKKYISNLEVQDEGEYWETGDIAVVKKKMDFINEKIGHLAKELSSSRFSGAADLSAEQIADRIEEFLRNEAGEDSDSKDTGEEFNS